MENLKDEISKIAYYISNQVAIEKGAYETKKEKLEKKRLNVIKRFDDLIKTWEDRLAKQKSEENMTIITALNEGALTAIKTAKQIIDDELNAI